jgi:hypothetical protein
MTTALAPRAPARMQVWAPLTTSVPHLAKSGTIGFRSELRPDAALEVGIALPTHRFSGQARDNIHSV